MKNRTRSFKIKLWTYFALFTAFIFIVLWLLQTVFFQNFYAGMLVSDTRKVAEDLLAHCTKPDIKKRIDSYARQNSLLVVVVDEEGEVLYSSDEFKGMHKEKEPEQPPQKPEGESGNIARKSNYRPLPEDYSDILAQLENNGGDTVENISDDYYVFSSYTDYYDHEGRAVLYISEAIGTTGASVTIIKKILAIVTLLSLAAGFGLSWFIARKFSKPVAVLSQKAEKLGEKDYSSEYEKGFCSELDILSDTLDSTNEKLLVSRGFQMQLLSNVSHDLRTPLTMIKGYAEMIRDISWEDSEAMKEDIQVVIKETDRLNALVNEILTYSELQTENGHSEFEEIDLSELITGAAGRFEKLARPENVVIDKNIEPGITTNADPELIERALYNLMDNAVRHTGNGKKISVELHGKDDKAVIGVRDFGAGIPESELEHIWERYYTSRQRQGKGVSGLGLAIVKQIADIHRGNCYAVSAAGNGCTFYLELHKK